MNHHEQHQQHHQKEREERIKHQKDHERLTEQTPRKMHPAWFLVLGTVLIGLVVLVWIFLVP